MIITKPAIKRVTTKVSELAKAQDTTSEKTGKRNQNICFAISSR